MHERKYLKKPREPENRNVIKAVTVMAGILTFATIAGVAIRKVHLKRIRSEYECDCAKINIDGGNNKEDGGYSDCANDDENASAGCNENS